ncbi:MAG: SUMF1/EgtB/PvdO family nonheme iron enzyme [Bacteroidetes bacterium]|nr:SUMF1/EgtB/PvdO family nonheme iron enzyme [Bacteroidota bacterium]
MKTALIATTIILSTGLIAQTNSIEFKAYEQLLTGSTQKFKMVPIPAGSFVMGSSSAEVKREADEGPQKKIQVDAFWMSAYEVTRDQFDIFLKDDQTSMNSDVDAITRPSPQYVDLSWGMGKEGGYPANSMSQRAAIMYCRWLYQKTGIFYRLPTEAEWEFACRAGTTTAYFFGNDKSKLSEYAWDLESGDDKYEKVGQKKPNPWGLYDILGNLMEWTLDHYDPERYSKLEENAKNPITEVNSSKYPKVLRGGSFMESGTAFRSAKRFHSEPAWNRRDPQIPKSKWWLTEAKNVGIRLVRPQLQPSAESINEFFKNYLGL